MTGLAEALDAAGPRSQRANSLTPSLAGEAVDPESARTRRRSRRASSQPVRVRHEVSDEELPGEVHSAEFRHAFQSSKHLMADLENILRSSALQAEESSTIHALYAEAVKLAEFQYPSTRIVGFVGDSGVGKSSLLNSLLDTRALARTSNSGEACTCVATEYHYHPEGTFRIKTNLFTVEELRDQLRSMLRCYRCFHLHGHAMKGEEKRDLELGAKLAIDTFRAMFHGRLRNEDFLVTFTEDTGLEVLSSWAEEFRPSERLMQHSELSLQDCSNMLARLSSQVGATAQPAAWPYIKNINVFSNATILSTGLILVDLPGLRDLNAARRTITERYLVQCDEIFAVCNIGRASTDEGVSNVFELARQARLSNVGVVCTRSEEIQAEESIVGLTGDRADRIRQMMAAIATDKRDARRVQDELDGFGNEDLSDLSDLSEDEREDLIELTRRMDRISLQAYLVSTRNESVSQQLRGMYSGSTPDQQTSVFCVSNKEYWDNRDKERNTFQPHLQLSGILDARRHCMSVVASSQRRATMHYTNDQIPAFLAQIDHWVQSGARSASQERQEMILRTLDDVEAQMSNAMSSRTSSINRFSTDSMRLFTSHVYQGRDITSWSRCAAHASQVWDGWSHPTYSAFCRNYGNYCTSKVGSHNWNEEAIHAMVCDLETPWREFRSALSQVERDVLDAVDALTSNLIERFETDFSNNLDTPTTLIQTLSTQQRLLTDAIDQAHEKLEEDMTRFHAVALSGMRSSLIGQWMEQPYQRSILDRGTGSDGRRKDIIRGALSDRLLFETLMREFKAGCKALVEAAQEKISNAKAAYLDIARRNFGLVRDGNAMRESELDPQLRSRLQEAVRHGRNTLAQAQAVFSRTELQSLS
ncbi:uncharacterized protein F5Z01DRAFT_622392 [Emericellopsis atlantica]|uniref:Uncharacterized protein n=1 Tax=Emericellopsis atlantica TaxID=2614577 RepID=A0A9P8CPT4_9HYPO|nr:uncharacterized protein F5Z01DRAFT_622392 [Emericellopsis atlantica]KAG9254532.1 hypothetical protein F5Z01DRAFT_622392 [Emericellopsis atlantica]